MNAPLSVAVVVLNWNGRSFLQQFLPALIQSTYPNLSIWVADNASTDDSVSFLQEQYPTVKLVRNQDNLGFAEGYNQALKQVEADIYVLLNSDVEVPPGWIEPVVELMSRDPGIAACQPKILDWKNRQHFEYAGGAGGWIDRYGYPFCRGRIFDAIEADKGQYNDTVPIFWASGAAMFVRSGVFHAMGGFDPYFFAHQEEIDLCWRIQHAGYRVMACPQSVVYHVGGGTLPQGNPRKIFLNFRNNLVMLWKNLGDGERLWKIPYRMVLDLLSVGKNIAAGKWAYAGAVLRAHVAYTSWLIGNSSKTHFPKNKRVIRDTIYPGNVVWMHFFRGMDSFREILSAKK